MKNILRSSILVAGAAAAMIIPTTPASAANAAVVVGDATIGCFGCGVYGPVGNSATFTAAGTVNGVTAAGAAGSATYTVNEAPGTGCIISGSAEGSISVTGVGSTNFNWTRTGAVAIVTTGWGTAAVAFAVTSPVGNPCGGAVTAKFAGALVGA